MPKFAAKLSTLFTDAPFPARFARAAAAGFAAVEFQLPYDHPREEIAALLRRHDLTCVMFNMPSGKLREKGLAAVPGREREFEDSVLRAVDYARAVGAGGLHAMAGLISGDREQHYETYVRNLRAAAGLLADHGLTLLIEPISHAAVPGYFLPEMHLAAQACADVDAPNLGIQMDFYHTQMQEGRPAQLFLEHAHRIRHIQVSNAPGRHEPGYGEIDYADIFKTIDLAGYTGWVGYEYTPQGRTEQGLNWMTTLTRR